MAGLLAACGDDASGGGGSGAGGSSTGGSSTGGSSTGGSSTGGSSTGGSSTGGSSAGGSSTGGSSAGGSSTGGSSTGGSSTGGSSAGGNDPVGGGGAGGVTDCASACAALYACGLETDSAGDQLCPNFDGTPSQSAQFTTTCESGCATQPALISLIDPSDCAGTIGTLSTLSPDFDQVCSEAPPPPMGCTLLCGQLYDCGVENDNCPGFLGTPADRDDFIAFCIPECTPVEGALAAIVNPMNCAQTVSTISNASPVFAGACQNGVP